MGYNHILTQKNNCALNNDLWTSPEFQVVTSDQIHEFAADDEAGSASDEEDVEFDVVKHDISGKYRAPSLKAFSLPPPRTRLRDRQFKQRDTSPSPAPATTAQPLSSLLVETPQAARGKAEEPSSNETVAILPGPDRTRIADFAVAYLVPGLKSRLIYGIQVIELEIVNVPIIIEGKRPPSRSNSSVGKGSLENRVAEFMSQGKADIARKMPFFFNAHPSDSYVGIAFAGPWWSFTICTPDAIKNDLRWSKAFYYYSHHNKSALSTIFDAAQNFPADPQKDPKLCALLNDFEEEGKSLTFVR
jgi:hypothetical protein